MSKIKIPKISKKILSITESQTLALTALAQKLKSEGHDVISLTAGEPDFATPQSIKDAAVSAIVQNQTKYTANQGILPLREKISEKLKRENGITWSAQNILVSNGAKHSISNVLIAICNPGDEVIIPSPFWVSYPEMVLLADAKPVILETNEKNNFEINPKKLEKAITKKTKALILCSPSNPTGAVYSKKTIEAIVKIVEKTNIFILSDEIYEKIIYDNLKYTSIGSYESIKDLVITINGVSKAYSMTGWRIGFAAGLKEVIDNAAKIQSQMTSCPSSISQHAALKSYSDEIVEVDLMRSEFEKRRNYFVDAINTIPHVTCIKPKGAFYLFPNIKYYLNKKFNGKTLKTSEDIVKYFIEEEKLVMVPGDSFGSKNHIRLSYACSMENLEKAFSRLKSGFSKLN